ncbi:MAG: ABC transporter ATP-binding protein [Desulfurococcaceae archaeon]
MSLLRLENVNAGYGEFRVLHDISLEVGHGEIVAIVGPNGVGKTTLLKTIMGLTTLYSGKITVEGVDVTRESPDKRVKRGLVLIPEGRGLFPSLTVRENLLLGAYTVKSKKEVIERLELVYTLFPRLRERELQKAKTLSGGEAQMLAIARGLMSNPKLLMLDEPSLGLAPKIVVEVFEVVKKLREQYRISILLVEQHVKESLEIADRGYVIQGGRIIASGKSSDLLNVEELRKIYMTR